MLHPISQPIVHSINPVFTYYGYTLVDITNTGDIAATSSKYRNQQRNWEVIKQVLGLRTQIAVLNSPSITEMELKRAKFGKDFTGKHYVWTFKFGVEHVGVFADNISEFGALETNFENVPIIIDLAETAKFGIPVFCTDERQRNIYFVAGD